MKFNFENKNPRNLTKCVKCGHEYSMGMSIQGEDGTTKAWEYNKVCPECGQINDDGIKTVFGKAREEKEDE